MNLPREDRRDVTWMILRTAGVTLTRDTLRELSSAPARVARGGERSGEGGSNRAPRRESEIARKDDG